MKRRHVIGWLTVLSVVASISFAIAAVKDGTSARGPVSQQQSSEIDTEKESASLVDACYSALHDKDFVKVRSIIAKLKRVNELDRHGNAPLHHAAFSGPLEIVELLVEHNANVRVRDRTGDTPLHGAARGNEPEIAEFLLQHGADINARNRSGQTPLHEAASSGHLAVVEVLIRHGADVNAIARGKRGSGTGATPLDGAATFGYVEVAELLILHGANVDANEKQSGFRTLHSAASKGRTAMVELLLRSGADVNAKTKERFTPLYLALLVEQGDTLSMVKLLLEAGADPNVAPVMGGFPSPLQLAKDSNRGDLAELLRSHGAKETLDVAEQQVPDRSRLEKRVAQYHEAWIARDHRTLST